MRGKGIMADMPVGDCRITKKIKTFVEDDLEVHIAYKTEIRTDGATNIVDREKTRVFKSHNKISKLYVNLISENNIEQKMVEYVCIERKGDFANVHKHLKLVADGKVIDDCIENSEHCVLAAFSSKKIFNRISSVVK